MIDLSFCQKFWKVIPTGFVHLIQTRGIALPKVWYRQAYYSQHDRKPLEHWDHSFEIRWVYR
jgi:hypothetical protein